MSPKPKLTAQMCIRDRHKDVRSGKDYSGNDWGIVNKDNNFVRPDLLGEGTDCLLYTSDTFLDLST